MRGRGGGGVGRDREKERLTRETQIFCVTVHSEHLVVFEFCNRKEVKQTSKIIQQQRNPRALKELGFSSHVFSTKYGEGHTERQ